jgi:uncharacterized membrane protein
MILLFSSFGLNYYSNFLLEESNQNIPINNLRVPSKGNTQLADRSKIIVPINDDQDVGIEEIIDLDAMNSMEHYPGKIVHLKVIIKNFGEGSITTPFDLVITVSNGSESYPNYFFQEVLNLPNHLKISELMPNSSYELFWNWTSPITMPEGSKYNFSDGPIMFRFCFTTVLPNDQVSSNNQICKIIRIDKPDFNIMLDTDQLIYYFSYKHGEVNQIELNFTLYNLGEATFINYSTIAPKDWKAIPPPRQFWQAETNSKQMQRNLSLMVFPSVELQYLPTDKYLPIKLTAIAESYILAKYTLIFKIWVSFIPKPVIIPPNTLLNQKVYYVEPGENYIDFFIKNMGNGEDNFYISIELDSIGNENGLNVELYSSSITNILKPGESQVISINLTVPKNIDVNKPIALKLFAESLKAPDYVYGSCNITYYVFSSKYREVSFELDQIDISMYPESEKSVILLIRNTGNYLDDSVQIIVTKNPQEWRITLDTSNIPNGGILRNGTAEVEIKIVTPQLVGLSHYIIELSALSENEIKDNIQINVNLLETRNLSISSKKARKSGNPGEKVPFIVTIENMGNVEDYFQLNYFNVTPNQEELEWKIIFSKKYFSLLPYSSQDVIIYIKIPYKALADIDFSTLHRDGYLILIGGHSQNYSKVKSDLELEVIVNPIYDFNFNEQEDEKFLILNCRESVYYSLSITNEGNDLDYYKISYESKYDWLIIPSIERRLSPGVTETLNVEIKPRDELIQEGGEYIFKIIGTSKKEPGLFHELVLTIKTIHFDLGVTELRIGPDEFAEADARVGKIVLLRAKIVNNGELDFYNITIKKLLGIENEVQLTVRFTEGINFIGETEVSYVPSKKNDENNSVWISVPWKIVKVGLHDINVELDPEARIPESRLVNNKLTRTIEVMSNDSISENRDKELSSNYFWLILFLNIIFLIFLLTGLYMTMRLSIQTKKVTKRGYTKYGEYKPWEEVLKMRFETSSDDENEIDKEEDEFDLVVLSTPEQLEQLVDSVKNNEEIISGIIILKRTKPIKKTKPIRKSKPMVRVKKEVKKSDKHSKIARQVIKGRLPEKPI